MDPHRTRSKYYKAREMFTKAMEEPNEVLQVHFLTIILFSS